MVARSFFALDSETMVVTSSSNGAIVGNPIINNSDTPDGTIFAFSGGGGTTITLDDDGFFADAIPADNNLFFNDDEPADHIITDGGSLVGNGTQVEAESLIFVRQLDSGGAQVGPTITLTVFSQGGVTQDVWGFSSDIALTPGVSYVKTGGDNDGTSTYDSFVICFAEGTALKTPYGAQAVETLKPGDLVWTLHDGHMPVRWAGTTEIAGEGAFAPVVFAPGSIGNDERLVVSQEHRVYLQSTHAEMLFGTDEVLVAAKHLCGLPGVAVSPRPRVQYVHVMFDAHQIVSANGVLTESFFLSEQSLAASTQDQQRELQALFPSLGAGMEAFGGSAVRTLKKHEARVLLEYFD
ncbi:MAG: Hint domain-containing protein [Pseudomonadota bacterium]